MQATSAMLMQMEGTLALLHNAAETYIPNAPLHKLDLEHLLYRPLARIRDSGLIEDLSVLGELEEIAGRTGAAIKHSPSLSWTDCHGDCHGTYCHRNDILK